MLRGSDLLKWKITKPGQIVEINKASDWENATYSYTRDREQQILFNIFVYEQFVGEKKPFI